MVSNTQDSPGTDRVTIRYLVRCMVEQSGAVRADQIARRVSLDVEMIREELQYWVAKGLVEVLRPVAAALQDESDEISTGSGGDYYRWIRPTDTDYVWQAQLLFRPPPPPRDSRRRDYDLLPLMHI